jgi:hypothetical protein
MFLVEAGGFNEKLATTQDYDMWFRLAAKRRYVHVPKPLVRVRYHQAQATTRMRSTIANEQENMYLKFMRSIDAASVYRYSRGDSAGFYLNLLCRFHAGKLFESRELAARKALEVGNGKICLRMIWARWAKAPLLRARVQLRSFLFASGPKGLRSLALAFFRHLSKFKQ